MKYAPHWHIPAPCPHPVPSKIASVSSVASVNMALRMTFAPTVVRNFPAGMTHSFSRILEYVSQEEYLYPGDFIASGTCDHGTCLTSTLQRWLQVGDVVEFEVEGIGTIRNEVVPSPRG